ncbi:Hypothetical protein A7982_05784 [Minicystis rosea]|nr:Hypothetical protein A7982_05784 [Minicystis rosea]
MRQTFTVRRRWTSRRDRTACWIRSVSPRLARRSRRSLLRCPCLKRARSTTLSIRDTPGSPSSLRRERAPKVPRQRTTRGPLRISSAPSLCWSKARTPSTLAREPRASRGPRRTSPSSGSSTWTRTSSPTSTRNSSRGSMDMERAATPSFSTASPGSASTAGSGATQARVARSFERRSPRCPRRRFATARAPSSGGVCASRSATRRPSGAALPMGSQGRSGSSVAHPASETRRPEASSRRARDGFDRFSSTASKARARQPRSSAAASPGARGISASPVLSGSRRGPASWPSSSKPRARWRNAPRIAPLRTAASGTPASVTAPLETRMSSIDGGKRQGPRRSPMPRSDGSTAGSRCEDQVSSHTHSRAWQRCRQGFLLGGCSPVWPVSVSPFRRFVTRVSRPGTVTCCWISRIDGRLRSRRSIETLSESPLWRRRSPARRGHVVHGIGLQNAGAGAAGDRQLTAPVMTVSRRWYRDSSGRGCPARTHRSRLRESGYGCDAPRAEGPSSARPSNPGWPCLCCPWDVS